MVRDRHGTISSTSCPVRVSTKGNCSGAVICCNHPMCYWFRGRSLVQICSKDICMKTKQKTAEYFATVSVTGRVSIGQRTIRSTSQKEKLRSLAANLMRYSRCLTNIARVTSRFNLPPHDSRRHHYHEKRKKKSEQESGINRSQARASLWGGWAFEALWLTSTERCA